MSRVNRRFWRADAGATATEYAFLITFIAMAIVGGLTLVGSNLNVLYRIVGNAVGSFSTSS